MALSRRMAAPFFVVLLVIVAAAATATARDVVDEKLCISQHSMYKSPFCDPDFCQFSCKGMENFTGGECKEEGFLNSISKCFCKKVC